MTSATSIPTAGEFSPVDLTGLAFPPPTMPKSRDLRFLAEAGLRDAALAELQRHGIGDLEKLAGVPDRELRAIPCVGVRAIAIIRAVIEAS